MKDLFDFILVRLYYRLFIRPCSVAKAASEWDIDLPGMKAVYRGPAQAQGHNPFTWQGTAKAGKVFAGVSTQSLPKRRPLLTT
jgi:hypothetical protein